MEIRSLLLKPQVLLILKLLVLQLLLSLQLLLVVILYVVVQLRIGLLLLLVGVKVPRTIVRLLKIKVRMISQYFFTLYTLRLLKSYPTIKDSIKCCSPEQLRKSLDSEESLSIVMMLRSGDQRGVIILIQYKNVQLSPAVWEQECSAVWFFVWQQGCTTSPCSKRKILKVAFWRLHR